MVRAFSILALACAAFGCASLPEAPPPDLVEHFTAQARTASLASLAPAQLRPRILPHGFRVAALAEVSVPPPLSSRDSSTAVRRADSFADFSAWSPPRAFGQREETFIACRGKSPILTPMPARWLSLKPDRADIEAASLTISDAWVSGPGCMGWVAATTHARAMSIHPSSLLYALVDTALPSAPDLVVYMPEGFAVAIVTDGAARVLASGITEARLPLRAHSAASLTAELPMRAVRIWYEGLGIMPKAAKHFKDDDELSVLAGVEITPAENGGEPTGMAWVALSPHATKGAFDSDFDEAFDVVLTDG